MLKSRSLSSPFWKSCAKACSTCHWELHQPWSPKGRKEASSHWLLESTKQVRRVLTRKLLTAAHQLYLPKKVAMTVAFMVSKAKSGCVTKEHWKGKEEYIRLHLEASQMTVEEEGLCTLLQPFTVLTHCILFSCFVEQLMSPEEMVFGLQHSHGLIFYFCPKFAFCFTKTKFRSTYLFLKPVAGEGMMGTDMLWQLFKFIHYSSKT